MRRQLYVAYAILFALGMWAAGPSDHDTARAAPIEAHQQ